MDVYLRFGKETRIGVSNCITNNLADKDSYLIEMNNDKIDLGSSGNRHITLISKLSTLAYGKISI